ENRRTPEEPGTLSRHSVCGAHLVLSCRRPNTGCPPHPPRAGPPKQAGPVPLLQARKNYPPDRGRVSHSGPMLDSRFLLDRSRWTSGEKRVLEVFHAHSEGNLRLRVPSGTHRPGWADGSHRV